jgi:hypothetical protein
MNRLLFFNVFIISLIVKGSVLDNDNYISQSQSPEVAGKLRVENAAAHHESW